MAFSWKFYNESDKKVVDEFTQRTQNIAKNHARLREINGVDLSDEEEQAMENLFKRYKKKLDNALSVITDFDEELEGFVKDVEARLNK